MFQYAFMRNLQAAFSAVDVCADLSDYRIQDYHYGLELGRIFHLKIQEALDDDITRLSNRHPWKYGRNAWRIYRIINKLLGGKEVFGGNDSGDKPSTYYVQKPYDTWKDISSIAASSDWYFDGWWQNEQFFCDVNEQISKVFSFKEADYAAMKTIILEMQEANSVSVHIRRGDYVGTSFDCLPENYYEEAIEYISRKVETPFFYFFSEDHNYVEKRFAYLLNKRIVTANSGAYSYRDLLLMTCCKHNIIANSSFSYWGAHLNKNEKKIVVAPRRLNIQGSWPVPADKGWIQL